MLVAELMEVVDSLDVKNKISKMRMAGYWARRRQSVMGLAKVVSPFLTV